MMTPQEMRCAATKICDEPRLKELSPDAVQQEVDSLELATVSAHSAEFAEDVLRNIIEALDHLVALQLAKG